MSDQDIHDVYAALTRTTTNREAYTKHIGGKPVRYHHITSVPSLVLQLIEAEPAGSGEKSGTTAGSRPAARLEALDTVMLIDSEASAWLRRLGHDDPADTLDHRGNANPGTGTVRCIKALHVAMMDAKPCHRLKPSRVKDKQNRDVWCCTRHHIEADVRRWWHQARIMTGYDSPSWRPDNTCPVCDQRRSLRIKLAASTAVCVECRTVWPPDDIGLLAEHIRWENREDGAEPDANGVGAA